MLTKLHNKEILDDFYSVQSQLTMEMELKQFFVVTPASQIAEIFKGLSGSVMNQFAYLNLVLKVIRELNVEPVQTFALLQAVRPVIHQKFQVATVRFIGRPVTNSSQAGEIVFEAIALFTRLTDTYDSIVNEARRFGDSQTFIIGSAIHMALSDKVRLVLCYLQLYQEVPEEIWKNAHRLYLIAGEANVTSQIFQDKLAFPNHTLTIRQVYLYIFLLATAGSRSLSTDEIAALAEFLKDWVKLVNLVRRENGSTEQGLYIDPAHSTMPFFASDMAPTDSPTLWLIDLQKIKEKLGKAFVQQKFVEGVRYTLSPWSCRKILDNWTRPPRRVDERISTGKAPLIAKIGLPSANVAGPLVVDHFAEDLSEADVAMKKLAYDLSFIDLQWKAISTLSRERSMVFLANVIDYSGSGCCLEWSDKASGYLSINELVLLQEKNEAYCKLGQIVWMKTKIGSRLHTGVSFISWKNFPVAIRLSQGGFFRADGDSVHGFITGSTQESRQHYGLLLKNKNLKTGQIVELLQDGQQRYAKLLEPLGHNDKYQCFNLGLFEA